MKKQPAAVLFSLVSAALSTHAAHPSFTQWSHKQSSIELAQRDQPDSYRPHPNAALNKQNFIANQLAEDIEESIQAFISHQIRHRLCSVQEIYKKIARYKTMLSYEEQQTGEANASLWYKRIKQAHGSALLKTYTPKNFK
jgi:hypothetical protein